jgi:hypothetical protein
VFRSESRPRERKKERGEGGNKQAWEWIQFDVVAWEYAEVEIEIQQLQGYQNK